MQLLIYRWCADSELVTLIENFQAQTWVEHAIFALRERRLTTWPLRLVALQRKNEVLMSKLIVMLKGLLTPVTVITNYISTSLLVKNYSFQSGHKSYMNK